MYDTLQAQFPSFYELISNDEVINVKHPRMYFEVLEQDKFKVTLSEDDYHQEYTTYVEYDLDIKRKVKRSKQETKQKRKERLEQAQNKPVAITVKTTVYKRNADVIVEVLERADGVCENCGEDAPFIRASDRTPYLEVHHRVPLSAGGEDTVENAVGICPNCHRELHFGQQM